MLSEASITETIRLARVLIPKNVVPLLPDVREEIVFVGYFLKVVTYTAFDHQRGTPLLIGRARLASSIKPPDSAATNLWTIGILAIGGIVFVGWAAWNATRSRQARKTISSLPADFKGLSLENDGVMDHLIREFVPTRDN